jgi:ubiquinone/menaquinone biosynthesis C-methylase UbiE
MPLLSKLRHYIGLSSLKESDPAAAYDIWSSSYDSQPDNLMLALDEELAGHLLALSPVTAGVIADVGCGTGRHWAKLFARHPVRLIGFDVSPGMLKRLATKYPHAETRLVGDHILPGLDDSSCDLVLSTLTVAHLPDLPAALGEWNRVLKPGGEMIITDYHPSALAKGGQRTFREGQRTIAVRNHVYPIRQVRRLARQLGLTELNLIEKKIDDSMRSYYEKQNALPIFDRFRGVPIIYGLHLKKPDAAE